MMDSIFKKYFQESQLASIIIEREGVSQQSVYIVTTVNSAFKKEFAVDPFENINLRELFIGEYSHIYDRLIRAVESNRKNIRIILPNSERTFELSINTHSESFVIVEFKNVSEEAEDLRLVLMEQALEKSKKNYQLLFNEMKSLFASVRIHEQAQGTYSIVFKNVNPAFEKLTGTKRDNIIGTSVDENTLFKHSELTNTIISAFLTGNPIHFELYNKSLACYLDISAYKLDDLTIAIIANNITEQKNAENALRASEERYRSLLETADDRIAVFNQSMDLKFANPAFYTKLGYTQESYPKTKDEVLKLFVDPENFLAKLPTNRTQTHTQFEYQVRHCDGRILTMHAYFQTIQNIGYEDEALIISRDITELKKNEERLRDAKEKAEESDRLKSSFLANMSHEIRTPLNGILGFSRLLSRPNLSDEKKLHYINLIDNNGNHLLSIISDILDIAKIESNQLEVNLTKINLNEQFDSLLSISNTIVNKKDLQTVSVSVSKGLSSTEAIITSDPMRLTQIMRNLIENALKFTKNGSINFGYKVQSSNKLYFYVKDTGIGIASDKLNVIFEHFRQEDETITRKYGGTGLGLSICKHLVKKLGGNLCVESEKDVGSTFYFTLPYDPILQIEAPKSAEKQISSKDDTTNNLLSIGCCVTDSLKEKLKSFDLDAIANIVFYDSFEELKSSCLDSQNQVAIIDMSRSKIPATETQKGIKDKHPYFPIFAAVEEIIDQDKAFYSQIGFNEVIDHNTTESDFIAKLSFYFEV